MTLFKNQSWHVFLLLVLLLVTFKAYHYFPEAAQGELLGMSTASWFYLSLIIPIIHQIYVMLCWRYQLVYQSLTKHLGQKAFLIYKIGFFILFTSRFIILIILALANKQTIKMNFYGKYALLIILSILVIYAAYSVKRYFGFDRAAGIDHFEQEASKLPFVKKGIFQYTNNGMYLYAFLSMYIPAFLWQSKAALISALFCHIYIWIHYYCTELPDMKHIYGKVPK